MQLFYHPDITETDKEIVFSREESRHIVKVLRRKEGDRLLLTNGRGLLFQTTLLLANASGCQVRVDEVQHEAPAPYRLHMAVAPTKMNDRYEWFLEKATEIGVHEITPIICKRSERRVVKLGRLERVLQSALKQSLHTRFPVLNEPVSLEEFLQQHEGEQKFIAHCEEGQEKSPLFHTLDKNRSVTILIGPEGDFSQEEIQAALKAQWQPVSLGSSRLRTETAAIVACHTVALVNQS